MDLETSENKKEKVLMKNNILVRAKYSLTTNESRVFLLMLFKLQKTPEGVLSCSISHEELSQYFKSKRDKTVDSIKETLSSLRKKPIYFLVEKPNGKGTEWGEYGFINGFTYDTESKFFTIEASEKIYSLMRSYLEDGYTPNNLSVLMELRNSYSYRLYDLIRVWSGNKNIITYQIDNLREYLMLEDNYPLYADFKKRALMPAVDELNKTGFFEIEAKEQKEGRRVTSIDFIVKDKDKRKYFESPIAKADAVQMTLLPPDEKVNEEAAIDEIKEDEEIFYVPYYVEMTHAIFKRFEKDYKYIDFHNGKYEEALEEAYYVTLDKDNATMLNYKNYKLFKDVFNKKLEAVNKVIKKEAEAIELEHKLLGWDKEN